MVPPCFVKQQYLWNIALHPKVGCYNVWANFTLLMQLTTKRKIIVKWDYYAKPSIQSVRTIVPVVYLLIRAQTSMAVWQFS